MKVTTGLPSLVFRAAGESLVPTPIEHLRDLAAECRVLAQAVRDESTRRELLSVAERFERLARVRDQEKPVSVRSN
jgi:hypothetical protein